MSNVKVIQLKNMNIKLTYNDKTLINVFRDYITIYNICDAIAESRFTFSIRLTKEELKGIHSQAIETQSSTPLGISIESPFINTQKYDWYCVFTITSMFQLLSQSDLEEIELDFMCSESKEDGIVSTFKRTSKELIKAIQTQLSS